MRIRTTASTPSPARRRCHPVLIHHILLPAPTGRGRYWHPPSTRGSSLEHFNVQGRRSHQVLLHIRQKSFKWSGRNAYLMACGAGRINLFHHHLFYLSELSLAVPSMNPLQSTTPLSPSQKCVLQNDTQLMSVQETLEKNGFKRLLTGSFFISHLDPSLHIQTSAVFNYLMPKVVSWGRCNPAPFKLSKIVLWTAKFGINLKKHSKHETLILACFQHLELLVHG